MCPVQRDAHFSCSAASVSFFCAFIDDFSNIEDKDSLEEEDFSELGWGRNGLEMGGLPGIWISFGDEVTALRFPEKEFLGVEFADFGMLGYCKTLPKANMIADARIPINGCVSFCKSFADLPTILFSAVDSL